MTDRQSLSRRKLLWAAATIGAAASTGGGAAAMMSDSEDVGAMLTAGILDLNPNPSWGNADSTDGSASGSISGNEGRETVTVSVDGNPSYVWFRTRCKQCTPDEETLQVRFGLDVDADGTVDQWLDGFDGTDDGYLSLRTARERLGEGVQLGELAPSDTWELVVEWTTDGPVTRDLNVSFDFEFYATQTRHVMNTDTVAPDWECPDVVCDPSGGNDDQVSKEISFVAFCSPDDIEPSDVSIEFDDDGRTVTLVDKVDSVTIDTVIVKAGQRLDVFPFDGTVPTSFTTGGASEFYIQGSGGTYPASDPERSNADPCPESEWIKYEVDTDVWETDSNGGGA